MHSLSRIRLTLPLTGLTAMCSKRRAWPHSCNLSGCCVCQAFADLKRDIALKSDIIKKLQKLRKNQERENQELRVRCERSNASLAELMDELAAAQKVRPLL